MPTELDRLSGGEPNAPGNWYVFETFDADGSIAIGVAQGQPDPSAVMVVSDGLTQDVARETATRLATERRVRIQANPP